MLIRSKDKEILFSAENVISFMVLDCDVAMEIVGDGRYTFIGKYSTKEKAMRVLNMIEEHYNCCEMQKIIPNECGEIVSFIFQMPQDKEV